MAQFLLRRRRFLAGCVTMGFVSPAALAQSPPSCEIRNSVRDGLIVGTEAGVYWDSLQKEAFQRRAIAVAATGVETSPCVDERAVDAIIRVVEEIREGGFTHKLVASVRTVDESLYRVPSDLKVTAQLGFNGQTAQVPLLPDRYEYSGAVSGGFQIFGQLTGDLTLLISTKANKTPERPDMVFRFSGSEMNRAWGQAQAAVKSVQAQVAERRCTVRSYAPPGGSCFLTTAAVETIGLADDCWELETLRAFRDGWLAKQGGGAEDIALYERDAPAIAEGLRADPQRLTRIYFTGILPSALAAKMRLNRLARSIYSHHMRRLAPLAT